VRGPKRKDFSEKRYGMLLGMHYVRTDKYGRSVWLWLCDCGNKKEIIASAVKNKHTKSCGCLLKNAKRKRPENLIGKWFGYLYCFGIAQKKVKNKNTKKRWNYETVALCLCACGRTIVHRPAHLKQKTQETCGKCTIKEIPHRYAQYLLRSCTKKKSAVSEEAIQIKMRQLEFNALLHKLKKGVQKWPD